MPDSTTRHLSHRARGNAIVELALLAPILGLLLAGLGASAVVIQAQLGLVAVAEEAAQAASYAPDQQAAITLGQTRGRQVGQGYALRNGSLEVTIDPAAFAPGGVVRATARYQLSASQVPLLGLAQVRLEQHHAEPVPRYRGLGGTP